jgi:hypothetical protein
MKEIAKKLYLILTVTFILTLPSVLSMSAGSSCSRDISLYYMFADFNQSDGGGQVADDIQNAETGQGFGEAGSGLAWHIYDSSLHHTISSDIDTVWFNTSFTQNNTVRIYYRIHQNSSSVNHNPEITAYPNADAGGSGGYTIRADNANGHILFTIGAGTTDTGYTQVAGTNYSLVIQNDITNYKSNITGFVITNASGVYTETEVYSVAFDDWQNAMTSIGSYRFRNRNVAGGDQLIDNILISNYIDEDDASVCPQDAVPDTSEPYFGSSSINNTEIKINDDVLISIEALDDVALDWIRIAHNQSGSMTNQSLVDISGVSKNETYTLGVALPKSNVIGYQWWINDTSNNVNTSNIETITVINTPPSVASIIYPTASLRTNIEPVDFNVTSLSDADSDIVTYYYYVNETLNATSINNISSGLADGYYKLEVSAYDNEEFSSNSSVEFEIDTTNPILTVTSPTDTATYDANISVSISCIDSNPFLLNYTVVNSSSSVVKSTQDDTVPLAISEEIDITNLADGLYNMTVYCSDSHTKALISNYNVKTISNGLDITTSEDNNIKIVQQSLASPSTAKVKDRYEIHFGTSLLTTTRTFRVTADKNIYIVEDSGYKGHLVVLNKDEGNWIDFENSDSKSVVTINRVANNIVDVEVTSKSFNFNSIGGLNIVSDTLTFTIDTTVPAPAITGQATGIEDFPYTDFLETGIFLIIIVTVGLILWGQVKKK